jgi:hypothetical protein
MDQLINVKTGEFKISNDFMVSGKTAQKVLLAHFGQQALSVNDFKNGYCNYSIPNLKIGEWYFMFTFYFLNDNLTKLGFLVQAEPYNDKDSWENFDQKVELKKGKYMEQWMAKQMQGDYKRYDWGKAGVNYDFHNLSYSCAITYNLTQNL